MDERTAKHALPPAIDLAREPDFQLGRAHVHPPLCTVDFRDHTARAEPRVMQVLIALAHARGKVLTRDELIDQCWGGRIVGDDAINRTLGKLRQLAQETDPPEFAIETVPKIGYRLVAAGMDAQARRVRRNGIVAAAAVILGILVLAAGAFAVFELNQPGEWSVDSYSVLAGDDLTEAWPDISADGRMVAYVVNPLTDNADIWMRNVAGGEPVPLARGPTTEHAPAFSPDGDRIAFVKAKDGEPCRIIVKPLPDGAEQQVGRCRIDLLVSRISWTPSGDGLIFSETDAEAKSARVRRLDLRTRRVVDLTHPPAGTPGDLQAVVSPDGRSLAFVRYDAEQSADVFVKDLRDGRLTRVTNDHAVAWVDWAPDGRDLFVASPRRSGESDLWVMDPKARRAPRRLVVGLQTVSRPAAGRGAVVFELIGKAMEAVRRAGTRETSLASGAAYEYPDISSRGDLALLSNDSSQYVQIQKPGQPLRRVLELSPDIVSPHALMWSPDGSRVLLAGSTPGREQLFIIDPEAASVSPVRTGRVRAYAGAWSADGRSLLIAGTDGTRSGIWQAPVSGDAPRLLAVGDWRELRVDGDAIYVVDTWRSAVWRLDPGAPPKRIASLSPRAQEAADWQVRGGGVEAIEDPGEPSATLRTWTADGVQAGPPQAVPRTESFAVDPRSRERVFLRVLHVRGDIGIVKVHRGRGLSGA